MSLHPPSPAAAPPFYKFLLYSRKSQGGFLPRLCFLHGVKRQRSQRNHSAGGLGDGSPSPLEDSALWALSFKIAAPRAMTSVQIIFELAVCG